MSARDYGEGMPGFMKALKIVGFIESLELTHEEIHEALEHHRRADTTHGLLWGNIANFGRETEGLELLEFLCRIQKAVKAWKADDEYEVAVVAAHLQKTQEALA